MAFCVLLSPILSVRPRQASTYALAPHTLAPHTVLSSIDNSDPLLNPACGLGIPGWVPGELVPGVMSSGGFNGTGSFTAQDFKGHTRCVSVVADVHRMAQKKLPVSTRAASLGVALPVPRRVAAASHQLFLACIYRVHTWPPPQVVVWFHGVTDDATVLEGVRGEMNGAEHGCAFRGDTEANSLASLTFESDFALLCPEASRFDPTQSSPPVDQAWNEDLITLWEIPSEMSSAGGGTPCNDTDSRDLAFLEAMLGALDPTRFDLSRIYVAGVPPRENVPTRANVKRRCCESCERPSTCRQTALVCRVGTRRHCVGA
eukprot:138139-Prymnesium_polylepis.1